jgi:uncharacterized protein YndB with AHSA1/START domain
MNNTSTVEVTTPSDVEIRMTRTFDAPPRLVYAAHTKPELVRRWLTGPEGWEMSRCEIDLRAGGTFRYEWRNVDGREMGMGGDFREIEEPTRLVHTELFDEDWTGGEVVTTSLFVEDGEGRTALTVTSLYPSKEGRDGAIASGMTTGVDTSYDKLAALLASPDVP